MRAAASQFLDAFVSHEGDALCTSQHYIWFFTGMFAVRSDLRVGSIFESAVILRKTPMPSAPLAEPVSDVKLFIGFLTEKLNRFTLKIS